MVLLLCPQVVGAHHLSPTLSPAQFGSARVRACDKAAHGPTLITIDYGGVGIYTTQYPRPIQCGTKNKDQNEENSSFPAKTQSHIQQSPPKL